MKMIRDLGTRRELNKGRKLVRWAIYECPICKTNFECRVATIKSGGQRSCGCARFARNGKSIYSKHNLSGTPIYAVWSNMKTRCYSKNRIEYKNYGGRGITVCDEWKNNFTTFYIWTLKNDYKTGLEIDRMNNDGNYTPDNCKFSTRSQNSQNTKLIHKNNTSGYRCVFWHITDKKWKVIINHQGKRYNIGSFKNSYDAALAYNEFVIKNKTLHPLNIL